jgi:S1-C subfamily serine protease
MKNWLNFLLLTLALTTGTGVQAQQFGQTDKIVQRAGVQVPTMDESFAALERKDYSTALAGFAAFADKGNIHAQGVLAIMYVKGWGTPKDDSAAFYWHFQAAEQGDAFSQASIGIAYDGGLGIARDVRKANFWWRVACQNGKVMSNFAEDCATAETFLPEAERSSIQVAVKNWRAKSPAQAKSLALASMKVESKPAVEIAKPQTIKSNPLEAGADVFSKVSPSVFLIRARTGTGTLQGSGVAYKYGYSNDYKPDRTWIATNAHVVAGSTSVTVESSGRNRPAKVEYADADLDLALIVVQGEVLPLAKISKATKPVIGSRVFAIGSPFGLENTISEGLLSGVRESKGVKTIQTSAAISSGNSGGGLFDADGQLLGITTFKLKGGENLNFAVDSSYIGIVGDALMASGLIRASYQRKVVRAGDENDLDERYIESPNLTRWLLERTAPDGTPMYVYFNRLFDESIKTGERFSTGEKNFDQILREFLSGRPKTFRPQSSQATDGAPPATYRLTCPMYASRDSSFQFDLNIVVDVANARVNGRQANLTDSEITFMTGKDFGFTAVLNRYSARVAISSVQTPSLLTGTCTKLADRQL